MADVALHLDDAHVEPSFSLSMAFYEENRRAVSTRPFAHRVIDTRFVLAR
jgi:hypothetical protein